MFSCSECTIRFWWCLHSTYLRFGSIQKSIGSGYSRSNSNCLPQIVLTKGFPPVSQEHVSCSGQLVSFSSYVGLFSYSQTLSWCYHKRHAFSTRNWFWEVLEYQLLDPTLFPCATSMEGNRTQRWRETRSWWYPMSPEFYCGLLRLFSQMSQYNLFCLDWFNYQHHWFLQNIYLRILFGCVGSELWHTGSVVKHSGLVPPQHVGSEFQ